jgi:hypothetical protein
MIPRVRPGFYAEVGQSARLSASSTSAELRMLAVGTVRCGQAELLVHQLSRTRLITAFR